jgi:hypothetical protein
LQVPAVFSLSPAEQEAMTQMMSRGYLAQAPNPSQVPFVPHVADPSSLQRPRGSGEPRSMGQQVPSRPLRLHELQAPVQATLQHTPSAQCSEAHSLFALQAAPLIFLPQLPLTHLWPLTHWLSVAHWAKQEPAPELHENGAQIFVAPGLHCPAPLQA